MLFKKSLVKTNLQVMNCFCCFMPFICKLNQKALRKVNGASDAAAAESADVILCDWISSSTENQLLNCKRTRAEWKTAQDGNVISSAELVLMMCLSGIGSVIRACLPFNVWLVSSSSCGLDRCFKLLWFYYSALYLWVLTTVI